MNYITLLYINQHNYVSHDNRWLSMCCLYLLHAAKTIWMTLFPMKPMCSDYSFAVSHRPSIEPSTLEDILHTLCWTQTIPMPADLCWWVRPDMTPRETWTGPPYEHWTTKRERRRCSRFSPRKVSGRTSSRGFAGLRMERWWDSLLDSCDDRRRRFSWYLI